MSRPSTLVVAVIAVTSVLTVLITPAFDELPSTTAHSIHHTVALAVAILPLNLRIVALGTLPETLAGRAPSGTDLLALTCTRLC